MANGPLKGIKVLEFAGIGPVPFAGMLLSDLGADVIRIERPGAPNPPPQKLDARGRRTLPLDLKQAEAVDFCIHLCDTAEVIIEGNRPGVMERLGLGPDVLLQRNPRLVYGRMTGWGQEGPYAAAAGHDINYLSLSGALHAIGTADKPVPPLNLAADYGGGAMFLVTGILAAIIHARATGQGQVVDAAMTDGAAYLMALFYGMHAQGRWKDTRNSNLLDGAAPFYDTYCCADGKWISIGALEPQFYQMLLQKTETSDRLPQPQMDTGSWPEMKQVLKTRFLQKTRAEWCEILEKTDVCFAPVLSLEEAPLHEHNVARNTFVNLNGVVQPAPAPRFSVTPGSIQFPPEEIGSNAVAALEDWGVDQQRIQWFTSTTKR